MLLISQNLAKDDAASSFTPADLFSSSELGAYWDISETGTLWQDNNGTNPVTADGQSVGKVDDLSGNGRHLTQNLFGQRPIYRTSGGLHWLEFDGSNDEMSTSLSSSNITGPTNGGAMWACYTSNSAGALEIVLIEQDTGAATKRAAIPADNRASPNRMFIYGPDGSDTYLNYPSQQTPDTRSVIFSYDGTDWDGYRGGALVDSATDTAGFSATSSFRVDLGALVASSAFYLDGNFYGGGLIDRALTASEISDLDSWQRGLAGI